MTANDSHSELITVNDHLKHFLLLQNKKSLKCVLKYDVKLFYLYTARATKTEKNRRKTKEPEETKRRKKSQKNIVLSVENSLFF